MSVSQLVDQSKISIKPTLRVPRWMVLEWSQGVLLDRSGTRYKAVDERLMERMEQYLREGKRVVLTTGKDNEIDFSELVEEPAEYREILLVEVQKGG